MASDVEQFIVDHRLAKPALIGHSMSTSTNPHDKKHLLTSFRGAKVAMSVALRSPHLIRALVPVDNAPVQARLESNFHVYIKALQEIEERRPKKQVEADHILQKYENVSRRLY